MILGIVLLFLVLALHSQPVREIQARPNIFPHTVYTYWHKDINLAPTFTQLCVNSMRKTAKFNNWNFVLLIGQNIDSYLSEESKQQMKYILSHKKLNRIQNYADLVRLFVLRDNGGMWIDATAIFVQNFSWVEEIDKQYGVANKFSEEPDMVMFSLDPLYGGNRTIVFDERIDKDVVLFPGLQIWCFVAKPRCKFMNDWVDSIFSTYEHGTEAQFVQEHKRQGFKYRDENDTYYFYSNFHFQTLLQKKQMEIQANRSAFKERYAVEYYKLWNFNALETGFVLADRAQWYVQHLVKRLFYYQIDEIKSRQNFSIYVMKFIGEWAWYSNDYLTSLYNLRCLEAVSPIPEHSIINEFVLKANEEVEFVQRLRDLQRRKQAGEELDCKILEPKTKALFGVALLGALLVFSGTVFALFRCLQKRNRNKEGGQQFIP